MLDLKVGDKVIYELFSIEFIGTVKHVDNFQYGLQLHGLNNGHDLGGVLPYDSKEGWFVSRDSSKLKPYKCNLETVKKFKKILTNEQ